MKNKVGRPKLKRDCEMTRVLIPIPLKKTVKGMVKEYDRQQEMKKEIEESRKKFISQSKLKQDE